MKDANGPAVKWPMYRHTWIPSESHNWKPGMVSPTCKACGVVQDDRVSERACPNFHTTNGRCGCYPDCHR